MEHISFIQDMAVVMTVSAVIIVICRRFHLPVVLGYILAGLLIGPNTPPYALVSDVQSIQILSELGVIFLLFSIGLEFNLSRLARVGAVSFFAATFEIVLMIAIGFFIGRAFGWSTMNSLFLGAILSISSTTIIAKVLMETGKIKEQFAQVILGILVVEDLLAIVIIALLSGLASSGSLELREAGVAASRVVAFIAAILTLGFLLVPRLLRYIARFASDEMMVVTVLGLCLGTSLMAAKFGFSVALGAFLIGAVISETKEAKAIIRKMEPIRDMFTAIFFVSVGMLLSPEIVRQYWLPILILTLVTIVGKVVSCSVATFLTGYNPETALKVGLGLAQIGEFSFIIARLGEDSAVTSPFLFPIAVSVSGITTLTTPLLMRNTAPIIAVLWRLTPGPLRTVLGLYTGWLSNITKSAREKDVNQVFKRTGWFLIAVVSGLVLYGVGSTFLPKAPLAGAACVFILASGFYLWKSIGRVHERIEKIASTIFDQEQPPSEQANAHEAIVKLIREEYPWAVKTEDFLLPYTECGANQTIRDLRLRSETGSTIVSLYRDDEHIANPPPETKLMPGDVLLLLGDEEQVKAGIKFLQKKTREPAPVLSGPDAPARTAVFEVRSGFPFLGKTIRDAKLRRNTGATLLGIQKDTQFINSPNPDTVFEEGDVLTLFGLPHQLEAVGKYLQSS